MIFEVLFAVASQKVDAFGVVLKPLLPFLVIAVVLKMLELSIPKRRRRFQNHKRRKHGMERHKYGIERKVKELCMGCMTSLCGLAVFVCIVIYGSGWNLVIWAFVGLLLFILPILSGFLRFNKGRIGEWIVSSRLKKGLSEKEYTIINDTPLPIQSKETTQIDDKVSSCKTRDDDGAIALVVKPRRPCDTTHAWSNCCKGEKGEWIVSSRLRKGLPENEYTILNDVYLPIQNNETTQIDYIVVSRFGVFVVETKNFTGWIFADASSGIWTQVIYHEKNTFQNPMRQNFRHISAISENLGIPIGYIRGVVAFTGDCTFKTPMPEGVIYSRQAAEYIKSFATPILKEHERNDIVEALREWDASVTPEQRASHVGNLRKRHGG